MKQPALEPKAVIVAMSATLLCAACTETSHTAGERPQTYEVTGYLINRPLIAHVNASTDAVAIGSTDTQRGAMPVSQLISGGSPAQGIVPQK
jgi:hypothetical protein